MMPDEREPAADADTRFEALSIRADGDDYLATPTVEIPFDHWRAVAVHSGYAAQEAAAHQRHASESVLIAFENHAPGSLRPALEKRGVA